MSNIEFVGFANVEYTSIEVAQLYALIATATRRKELLRRCQSFIELTERYIPGDVFYTTNLHDELARELEHD